MGSKDSDSSCQDISNLFAEVFNCSIIDAFRLSQFWYLICYGLVPYFHQLLVKEMDNSLFIATSFDEFFNGLLGKFSEQYGKF